MPITNWTDFFREEKDIYVQNVANAQVSLEFEIAPGVVDGFLFSHSRNPINLTQHIPFDAIRRSVNFRKMLNRRPPVLQLLTEEEFKAFYERKAHDWKLQGGADSAIDHAEEIRQGIAQRRATTTDDAPKPIHKVVEDGKHFGERKIVAPEEGIVSSDEVINPRVLHICNQVGAEVQVNDKMTAAEMLEELEKVEPQLKLDDFEYVRAHGYWKSVKKWSQQKAAALASDSEEDDG